MGCCAGFLSFLAERVDILGRGACQPEASLAHGLDLAKAAAAAAGSAVGHESNASGSAAETAGFQAAGRQQGGSAEGGASAGALASPAGSVAALATTPAVAGDSSTVPGIRAAALAYALYAVACDLGHCNFPGWVRVWRRQLDATAKLAGMFGECPL